MRNICFTQDQTGLAVERSIFRLFISKLTYLTGGGQILSTRREVLPVADYIFAVNKCKYFPSISWENEP